MSGQLSGNPMRITLILCSPPDDPLIGVEPFMPLSLPLLAAAAPEHDYTFLDLLQASARIDFESRPDVVGISLRNSAEERAYAIADEFRRRGVKVVLGGAQASVVPHRAIEHANAVVVGEGESLWPILLDDLAKGQLKEFYVCSPRPFDPAGRSCCQLESMPDLANVAIPLRRLYGRKYRFDTVFAGRGCPVDCDFCDVPGLFGKPMRFRPVEQVVKEIASFKGFFYLLDDTVLGRADSYDYYLKLYEAMARLPKRRLWHGQGSLGPVASEKGREVIRAAARAGLFYVAVGMESLSPTVLAKSGALGKSGLAGGSDVVAGMKEAIAFMQEEGMALSGWFAVGYDEDDLETYQRTVEFCRETNVIPVLSPLGVLPGSRLFDRAVAEKRIDPNQMGAILYPHPTIRHEAQVEALAAGIESAYSMKEILRRTAFYRKYIVKDPLNGHKARVEKVIFLFILQTRLRTILRREVARFARSGPPGAKPPVCVQVQPAPQ